MPADKRTGETATRLPAQPTRLLGRESDLEAIQSVLWREEVRPEVVLELWPQLMLKTMGYRAGAGPPVGR